MLIKDKEVSLLKGNITKLHHTHRQILHHNTCAHLLASTSIPLGGFVQECVCFSPWVFNYVSVLFLCVHPHHLRTGLHINGQKNKAEQIKSRKIPSVLIYTLLLCAAGGSKTEILGHIRRLLPSLRSLSTQTNKTKLFNVAQLELLEFWIKENKRKNVLAFSCVAPLRV